MKKPLSKLERVPLREAWKHEANDFTPWLAEEDNLKTLVEALGLPDLELVATDHWVGGFDGPDPHLCSGYGGQMI
jgi:hypothetical protein